MKISCNEIKPGMIIEHKNDFWSVLKTQHDVDHPISFPEGAYLKCGYYRFLE